ncbi:MAG: DNA-protecting protein DprA [Ruminococcaceae bacterium]|nr:DNA-protecting protein DprA [Oscillospiraceae bacterium]
MLIHWIWLATRNGIGSRGQASLLRMFGTAENIYSLTMEQCVTTEGFMKSWLEPVLDKDLSEADKILSSCDDFGVSVLTYADPLYPKRLRNISDPPTVLYYRGKLTNLDDEVPIAIIGTRQCSTYGLLHAKQFSKLIANSGGIVVSGGARGIDTMAIKGGLDSSMPVICVIGTAIDNYYPKENIWLFREVERHGCVISEYPPGAKTYRSSFPQRNRIISGLSVGALVIEAPKGSGALITASHALEQGRDVYTIPGNIGVKHYEGNLDLLRDGAMLVTNGWEVLENYVHLYPGKLADGRQKENLEVIFASRYGLSLPIYSPAFTLPESDKKDVDIPPQTTYIKEKEPPKDLPEEENAIYKLLSDEPQHMDQIVAQSDMETSRVISALTMLQIKQLAEKQSGNYFVRK